jgi:hypothetical protein
VGLAAMTGFIPRARMASMIACEEYPESPMHALPRAWAMSSSAFTASWRWPWVSVTWRGFPCVVVTAWILVETPPRERPR